MSTTFHEPKLPDHPHFLQFDVEGVGPCAQLTISFDLEKVGGLTVIESSGSYLFGKEQVARTFMDEMHGYLTRLSEKEKELSDTLGYLEEQKALQVKTQGFVSTYLLRLIESYKNHITGCANFRKAIQGAIKTDWKYLELCRI